MNQFEQLQKHLVDMQNDENPFHDAEIEIAYQVNKEQKTVTPGINILAGGFEMPLFISIGELRDAADLAESKVKELMEC